MAQAKKYSEKIRFIKLNEKSSQRIGCELLLFFYLLVFFLSGFLSGATVTLRSPP